MSLGSSLYHARKKSGLSQENVAEKLGVSRQIIVSDIALLRAANRDIMATARGYLLYSPQAQQMIESVSDEAQAKIDWNKVWSKKYPVLATYHEKVRISDYAPTLREMLTQLRVDYGYNNTDALLVLKDILARVWKGEM